MYIQKISRKFYSTANGSSGLLFTLHLPIIRYIFSSPTSSSYHLFFCLQSDISSQVHIISYFAYRPISSLKSIFSSSVAVLISMIKHCRRHNGPEGRLVLIQILIKCHLQSIDPASTSKSQPNINISTKLKTKNLDKTQLQSLDLDSTIYQQQNADQTSASKPRLNFNFKFLTKLFAQSLNKNLAL